MFKSILVLESPWDDSSVESASVWPLVREFARARGIRAHHQTFLDKSSFQHWIRVFNNEKLTNPKLLYIAAHGDNARISGLRSKINKKTVISAIKSAKNINYVHFGSCFFGTYKNFTELLESAKHLKWAAGYEKEVDWVDSTLFDILLWGRIESRDKPSKGKKTHTLATELMNEVPGLAENLGFRFQHRYGNSIKSVPAGQS